jgi:putative Mg2+ transporter-C (MgtC) family protein
LNDWENLAILQHLVPLAIAYALALPMGWERELEARSAGLRTFPLVALASCGFIEATESMMANSPDATAKIIEGVIAGVGFIGGGAILRHGMSVHGTATAASVWATGAIGAAAAVGSYDVAIVIAAAAFLSLKLLPLLKPDPESGKQ